MKRTIFSFILLFALAVPMLMADAICDDLMAEGKQKYNAGQYEKAKSLFQTVIEQCGYNSAREWLAKCNDVLAPTTLSVSRTNVSVGAAAGSTTVTVNCNRAWSLKNTSSSIFSVSRSGNTLTIYYYANPNTTARSDYFDVASSDGSCSRRITVKQSAKSTPTPTAAQLAKMKADVTKIWVDHNVYENNRKGMRIHVDFIVYNMNGFRGSANAWFYDADSGEALKYTGTSDYKAGDNQICASTTIEPGNEPGCYYSTGCHYSNLTIFMPNDELRKQGNLKFKVTINEWTSGNWLGESVYSSFTYGNFLNLNKTSISATSSGATEYINISSSGEWEIQYPTSDIYSVTRLSNTQIRVVVNRNTTSSSRADYFNIKLKDGSKVVKVSISQTAAASSNTSSAKIEYAYIEHGVTENGVRGMRFHFNFAGYGVKNHSIGPVVHFSFSKSGSSLVDYNGEYADAEGKVAHSRNVVADFVDTKWNNLTLFFPISELHMNSTTDVSLVATVAIYDWTISQYLSSEYKINFTFLGSK